MNDVERRVMEFALGGKHPTLDVLREQLEAASVASRQNTGVGFFTHFAVPASVHRLPSTARLVIGDVYADVAGLQHGAGFLVFVDQGTLAMLECYIVEDAWPSEARIGRLFYVRPKSPGSPTVVESAQRDLGFALQGAAGQDAAADGEV